MSETPPQLIHKRIGVAIIWNQHQEILIDKRLAEGEMAGFWEFPGGKIEPQETVEACIQREIREELGIEIEVQEPLMTIEHDYSKFRVTLYIHHCQHVSGEPQPIECQEVRWVKTDELEYYQFPEANTRIVQALKKAVNTK